MSALLGSVVRILQAKRERVRRTWIPAASLLSDCSALRFVQDHPKNVRLLNSHEERHLDLPISQQRNRDAISVSLQSFRPQCSGTRSRESGKSPGDLLELFFKRFCVRSQRVKFALSQKPDVWQHNFFGLRQLTHIRIHKLLRLRSKSTCSN